MPQSARSEQVIASETVAAATSESSQPSQELPSDVKPESKPEPVPESKPEPEPEPRKIGKGLQRLSLMLLALAFLVLGAGVLRIVLAPKQKKATTKMGTVEQSLSPAERSANVYRSQGWVVDAQDILKRFFEAETVQERAQLTIRGAENEEAMTALREEVDENLHRTPVDVFGPVALSEHDSKRGIFLMTYNRPEQFAIGSFFRPIAPLRVKYGLEKADALLMTEASVNNFVDEPLKVLAFFKQDPDGLKLDWQTYAQTKYRLLDRFVSEPERGKTAVFRVIVREDVDLDGRDGPGQSVYRFMDPANRQDFAKILVEDDSELGRALAPLKWTEKFVQKVPVRNATVSMKWSDEEVPNLQMGELICWEFLGLGGE